MYPALDFHEESWSMAGKKIIRLLAGLLEAAVLLVVAGSAHATFDGRGVTTTFELWSGATPGDGGSLLAVTDTQTVTASDATSPDIVGFHDSTGNDRELWDIDFDGSSITLTYTSIYAWDMEHQYMYMDPRGFHFEDLADDLPGIAGISVDDSFAPMNFGASKVTFGENDIWVSLQGTMCHYTGMPMPECTNAASPTGYDNTIVLDVSFVPEPGTAVLLMLGLTGLGYASRPNRRNP
jgi:hypothetical protein